jgi:hypothetical protein
MKKRTYLICSLALACAVAFAAITLRPASAFASVTQTLLSENFSGASFPPAGWSANRLGQNFYYGGWYRSNGGKGGSGGGVYGSAVAWTYYGYQPGCYGTSYSNITLTAPAINTSGFSSSSDSLFLDFDVWFPYNYYENYYYPYQEIQLTALSGATTLAKLVSRTNSTFYTGSTGYTDPSSYTSAGYWAHYRAYVPFGTSGSTQIAFNVTQSGSYCYFGYMYTDNVAITNVTVTDVHYDVLSMNGPSVLDFGRIPYQTPSAPLYTKFTNNSTRTINLSNFNISGAQSGDFQIVYSPSSVGVGVTDSVGVVFTPQGSGGRFGTLTFNTDADVPKVATIALQGFGLQPSISFPNPFAAIFSQTRVRFGGTATRSILIQNTGPVPLHVYPQNSSFSGDYPQFYSVVRWPAASIAPGAIDSVVFSFSPYVEGLLSAQFNLASDASNGMQTLNLRGIGILPHLVVTTNATSGGSNTTGMVNFGQVAIGDSTCQTMVLHNTGSDTLVIQKQIVTYGDYDFTFTLLNSTDQNLAPDQSKLVNVCFKPLQRGIRMASLRFYTNISPMYPSGGDSSQYLIQVTGNGMPYGKLAVSGSMNDTAIVNQSNCMNDTLWNTGAADLTISSAKLSGANAADFALSGATFPLTIVAGKYQIVQICYSPKVRGLSNASLDLTAASSDRSLNQSLAILGVGQEVCMDATPNPVAFGSTTYPAMTLALTGHDTTIISVKNCGDRPMSFRADSVTNKVYSIVTSITPMIAPQGTGTIAIAYNPDTLGSSSGSVIITPSESSLSPMTLPLNGQGAGVIVAPSGQPVSTAVGSSSTFTVTLTNNGNVAWTPGTAQVTGGDYSLASTSVTPTTIAPGQSGTLSVTFTPTQTGTRTGTLAFASAQPAPFNSTALPYNLSAQATSGAGVAMRSEQDGFALSAAYPNPIANNASVDATLPRASIVSVVLVRLDGSEAAHVFNGMLGAGEHQLTIDAKQLASGTYYCVMTTGSVKVMREVVVLK